MLMLTLHSSSRLCHPGHLDEGRYSAPFCVPFLRGYGDLLSRIGCSELYAFTVWIAHYGNAF